jgi:probable rRNA maturation factor
MSLKLSLNIEKTIKFAFEAHDAEEAILKVLQEYNLEGTFEVDLKIVSIQEIHTLNREYREIDKPTDVLSFPIHERVVSDNTKPILLGDIVLCPEMAEESIVKLIEHSTLHLIGIHHPGD